MSTSIPQHDADAFIAEATRIGRLHGRNAASWVEIDAGNAGKILAGIEDCDPAILDSFREPSLSGEYAGDYGDRDLAADLDIAEDSDALDDAASAYLDAASAAFWEAVETSCRAQLAETVRQALGYNITVRHADRADVNGEDDYRWISSVRVHEHAADGREPFADLGHIARGEDAADQSSTVQRSNYRRLAEDYPEMLVRISYANTDTLGAFLSDLTPELAEILGRLGDEYPVYDESDLSELESEEITASWDQYVRFDMVGEMSDISAEAYESWIDLSEDAQCAMFWEVCDALDIYPEHDGHDVLWTRHYPAIAEAIGARLAAR
jgi:hypothetical protein